MSKAKTREPAGIRADRSAINRSVSLLEHYGIDRVPRLRGAGAHAKERLRNRQIQCRLHAHEHGVDPAEIVNWCWPARGA